MTRDDMLYLDFLVLLGQLADVVASCYFISTQNPAYDLGWKGFLVVISSNILLKVFTVPFLVRDYC